MAEGDAALVVGEGTPGDVGATPTTAAGRMVAHMRREFDAMRRHRTKTGVQERLLTCLRLREGKYDPQQLSQIKQFGGSEVFANITHNKCRGAASVLRDIFLGKERPWSMDPTPVPTLPEDMMASVVQAVGGEVQAAMQEGAPPIPQDAIKARMDQLEAAAHDAAKRQARKEAKEATDYIDDIFVEGGFYVALDEFIYDFVTFPYAVLTGPIAVMASDVRYVDGIPQRVRRPMLTWRRADPSDVWWTPGAARVEDAAVVQRFRFSRAEINALVGLPGYDEKAVRSVLREYRLGYTEVDIGTGQQEIARTQNRDELMNEGHTIDVMAWTGAMSGYDLDDMGYEVDDIDVDYMVQGWFCGQYLLKVHLDPDPRLRVPYYIASYEPNPGSIAGTALPELFADLQQTCNASLRALCNNMGMASGPQVVINMDRVTDPSTADHIYPWKRWRVVSSDMPNSSQERPPVEFFSVDSHAQELMQVYTFFSGLADDISAVPKYVTGNQQVGGAGRTASGLSKLMGNSNRVMKSVAANIDNNVIAPAVQKCYDLVLLTADTDKLKGDEQIVVRGATTAERRETDRMRLLEFLQMTANPLDSAIIGPQGRAVVLGHVAESLGLDGETVVPDPEQVARMMAMQQAQAQQPPGGAGPGGQSPANPAAQAQGQQSSPGSGRPGEATDNMHRTSTPPGQGGAQPGAGQPGPPSRQAA